MFVAAAIRRSPCPVSSVCPYESFFWSEQCPFTGLRAVLLHGRADEVQHCTVTCPFQLPGYTVCKRTCHDVYERPNDLRAFRLER